MYCAWFYILFSSGQILLSTLSWRSACPSVSEGIFLMYPWKHMYSMSSYSSTILFSPQAITFQHRASSLKWNTKHLCLWTSSGHWWHTAFPQTVSLHFFFFFFFLYYDRGAWWAKVRGVAKSWTWLSDFIHWLIDVFIYVAVPGLQWGMWTLSCGMWDLAPWPGIKLGPLNWHHKVLDPGIEPGSPTLQAGTLPSEPPRKFLLCFFPTFSNLFQQYIKNIWKFPFS